MNASADRIRQSLSALVAIPSVTGDERAVQDEVARLMADAGMRVARYETDPERLARDPAHPGSEMPRTDLGVVAGYLESGRPGPTLMLSGHVDVVPAGDPGSWTSPPFEPAVRDGRLYGRGACDMKGGVVAALEAVRLVGSSSAELNGKVMVVTVPSEEDGGAGTLAAIRAGLVADMVVITEPTNLEVVVAHAGAITFVLDVPGKAAHAATRLEGVSALDKLTYLVGALRQDEVARNQGETHPLMRELGLAYPTIIGKVNGGEWASTVMDRVVAEGRYGVRLGQSCEEAAEDLRRAITVAWQADSFLSQSPVRLSITGARFDPSEIAADHPLPESLAQAARRVTGTEPRRIGAPYGADMRLMINEGGMPCVMYGPGDVRMAHAADENVHLDEVETCARVLADWIVHILG